MTDEELEITFNEALARWNKERVRIELHDSFDVQIARYFFWAGSEVGLKLAKDIYAESFSGQS